MRPPTTRRGIGLLRWRSVPESLPAAILTLALIATALAGASGRNAVSQTNRVPPAGDAALGLGAAATIRAALPQITDQPVNAWVEEIGQRLVDQIPEPLRQPAFRYSFEILDQQPVASYPLPGGPVFLTRGLLQGTSAQDLAARIAHDISHVALRHGTGQVSQAQAFAIGAISGGDLGRAIAGPHQDLLAQATAFGVTSYFLTFGPELEAQAEQLASQLVAAAGTGLPFAAFSEGQTRLRDLPPPMAPPPAARIAVRLGVVAPSGETRAVTLGNSLRLSVPSNWRRFDVANTATFGPEDAVELGPDGRLAVTHGIQVGVARSTAADLIGDVQALLAALSRAGMNVTWSPYFQTSTLAGRAAATTSLTNVSAATGAFEQAFVYATRLPGGQLLYLIGVSPFDESGPYRLALERLRESLLPLRQ
jgi:hypothetical protein